MSQYRLAFHLTLACAIYAAVAVDRAADRAAAAATNAPPRLRLAALAIAALVLVQIYLGALVAGLDAGLIYNTWPLIDGAVIPPLDATVVHHAGSGAICSRTSLTVQFDHRMLAYAIWLLAMLHAIDAWRHAAATLAARSCSAGAVTLQAALGIVTLLYQAPLPLALAHQVMAILVFTIAVMHAERLSHRAVYRARRSGGARRHDRRCRPTTASPC